MEREERYFRTALPDMLLGALFAIVTPLVVLMAGILVVEHPILIGIGGFVAGAWLIRLIVRWFNHRDDPRYMPRPPAEPASAQSPRADA